MPFLDTADTLLKVAYQGLIVFDRVHRTKYATEYRKITESLAKEDAKPIYGDEPGAVFTNERKDQGKIDRLILKRTILLEKFLNDDGVKNDKG